MTAISSLEVRLASLETSLGIYPSGGTAKDDDPGSPASPRDINSRIDLLVSKLHETARKQPSGGTSRAAAAGSARSASSQTLGDDWKMIDRLTAELEAGSVLSHQGTAGLSSSSAAAQPLTAPLLYRKQEVLASSEALADGMEQLGRIRDFLLATSTASVLPKSSLRTASAAGGSSKAGGSKASSGGKAKSGQGPDSAQADAERFVDAPLLTSERYEYATDPAARRRLHDVAVRVADINSRAVDVATRVDSLVSRYHRIMLIVSEKMVLADEELSVLERAREMTD